MCDCLMTVSMMCLKFDCVDDWDAGEEMMEAQTIGIVLIIASIGFWDVRSMACSVRWPSWNDVSLRCLHEM